MFTDFITNMINSLSELLYSHILIILLLGAGIFFTIKTKFVQIRMFIESLRVVAQPGSDKNGLSSFQALMVSTASRVGTGNIAGISTAICLGGSGAVFWMWLTAILGSASAFIESTLAQIYKHKAKDGSSYGGPAYYIQAALKKRWIGVLFAVVLILTYMGGFNLVASFNIADSFRVYSFFNPVKQGLVQMLSVFIDTILICSATAFMLLCSGVEPTSKLAGMPWVQAAASSSLGGFGTIFITIALCLFAFTTLIGNFYYAEMGLKFLCGRKPPKAVINTFRIIAAAIVLAGATMEFSIVWNTADVLMGLMALINLPVILILCKPAIQAMNDYTKQKKAGKDPVFKAADIQLKDKTDFWN